MNINERIKEIRRALCNDSNSNFASRLKKETNTTSNYARSGYSIGRAVTNDILIAFPEVNPSWLLFGEGKMLKDSTPPKISCAPHYENAFSKSTDAEIVETISDKFANHLVKMYESGRAYPAIQVETIKEELNAARRRIAVLEAEIALLRKK